MAVTAHVYPVTLQKINTGSIDLATTTAGSYFAGLCTGDASAWTSTQEAYAFVSDVIGAYAEVSGGSYARIDISSAVALSRSTNTVKWTCGSPINFGSTVSFTARSMFIFTKLVGSADASYPVISIVDFGANVTATAGAFTYTVDPTNGLALWTAS